MDKIYLDNSATTRISEAALAKYNEAALNFFGNPSSLHTLGHEAELLIKDARRAVCDSLGDKSLNIVFTASGTEANNLAIMGRALSKDRYKKGAKIISTEGEHASVNEPLKRLSEMGFKVIYIPTRDGKIDLDALRTEMTRDVVLVTVMMVNNETGALYDVSAVSKIMRAAAPEAVLHVDATQSYMKLPFTMRSLGADMITVSSHKIHGPKGVGALAISPAIIKARGITPITLGGGQELGLRSGTENVPAIAAFGTAVAEGAKKLQKSRAYLEEMREYLIEKLTRVPSFSEISITNPTSHAPHILNITLPDIKSETMLHFLSSKGIFVSSGSACSSNSNHTSSALTAFGRSEREADCSIRISLSDENTKEDLDKLCDALSEGLSRLARIR